MDKDEKNENIHEGDVVEILKQTAVVLAIDKDIASVYVLTDEYARVQDISVDSLNKVGYSIDVREVLTGACVAVGKKEVKRQCLEKSVKK